MIEGRKILTNAHAVEYGSLIQVKKRQSEQKYVASVVALGHECKHWLLNLLYLCWVKYFSRAGDLAILSIEDPTFWENTERFDVKLLLLLLLLLF